MSSSVLEQKLGDFEGTLELSSTVCVPAKGPMPLEHLSASEVRRSGPDATMAGHETEIVSGF